MKKVFTICLIMAVLFPNIALATVDVLNGGWEAASIEELLSAREQIDAQILMQGGSDPNDLVASTPVPELRASRSDISRLVYSVWNDRYKDICEAYPDATRYLFNVDQNGALNVFSITTKEGCEFSMSIGAQNMLITMAIARIPQSVFQREGIPADINYLFSPFISRKEDESVKSMKDISTFASQAIKTQTVQTYALIGKESPAQHDYDLYILCPEYTDAWIVMIQNSADLNSVIALLQ